MEVESFSIKSNASDRELVFLAARKDYFTVQLRGAYLQATRKVYAYSPHMGNIAELFSQLASQVRPWGDTASWESLEGELSLSATCSSNGIVALQVTITHHLLRPEDWSLSALLTTELGQLPSIGAAARGFFSIVAGT